MTKHEYLDRILPRSTTVPMLSPGVFKIVQMAEDPLCSPAELSHMIEADTGIATKVLTLANLPFHGQRNMIMSVPMAVTMLGTTTLKYALLSAAVFDMFRTGGAYFDMPSLWKHSIASATAARLLAEQVRYPNPEQAFTAGLLHDIGKIVIASYLPSSLQTIVEIMRDDHLAMYDAEQKAIGLAHPSFGAWVMEKWGLPAVMVEAVEYHHHPTRSRFGFDLAGIIGLASIVAHRCSIGNGGDTLMREADPLVVEYFGLNERDLYGLQDALLAQRMEIESFATLAAAV